ncbi:MAG: hypothetical protein AMXMBFR48_13600 [Ignavibacteriales bacterium]|jgi:hypothetical protein
MDQFITLLGTYFIGGYITLTIMVMNFTMSTKVSELVIDKYSQESAATTAQIIEADIYRAGYRAVGNPIVQADSTRFRFISDHDNDGSTDTISFYRGSENELDNTGNPLDFKIYRQINSSTPMTVGFATRFRFIYQSQTTAVLNYGSLNSQANRNNIRFITLYLRIESPDSINFGYSPVEWRKTIRPKNL